MLPVLKRICRRPDNYFLTYFRKRELEGTIVSGKHLSSGALVVLSSLKSPRYVHKVNKLCKIETLFHKANTWKTVWFQCPELLRETCTMLCIESYTTHRIGSQSIILKIITSLFALTTTTGGSDFTILQHPVQ